MTNHEAAKRASTAVKHFGGLQPSEKVAIQAHGPSEYPNVMNVRRIQRSNRFARGEWIRWGIFRVLEQISLLRTPEAKVPPATRDESATREALWIFVSTIGELNAIETLMRRLIKAYPDLDLVLISDHEQYREAYLAKYPDAVFYCAGSASSSAQLLGRRWSPRLFVIAEIPCILWDAPCRFTYAMVREARKAGALIALVNGWLYGRSPACRMDSVERSLLSKDYLHAIDIACVQTEDVRNEMIRAGMAPEKIHVTGNTKFDGLKDRHWDPTRCRSAGLLQRLVEEGRPIIVIGCMHNPTQQTLVIEAFKQVREKVPRALMVFAHRHPEIHRNLERITEELTSADISFEFRSKLGAAPPRSGTQCLILDTIGELKDFYAIADVTYVCADHSALEPLAYGKPVTTVSAWTKGLPNYPVYELLRSAGAIVVADERTTLARAWTDWLAGQKNSPPNRVIVDAVIAKATGATSAILGLLAVEDHDGN